jgi:DNA-directed RNA polymerase alpha subunit
MTQWEKLKNEQKLRDEQRKAEFEKLKLLPKDEVLKQSVIKLPLSFRAWNVLSNYYWSEDSGFNLKKVTIGELCELDVADLLYTKSCGLKTVLDIIRILKELDLTVKQYVPTKIRKLAETCNKLDADSKALLLRLIT